MRISRIDAKLALGSFVFVVVTRVRVRVRVCVRTIQGLRVSASLGSVDRSICRTVTLIEYLSFNQLSN